MFSLRMLLAVVAISAVYIAAIAYRTPWWEASVLTQTYLIFAGSIAASLLSRNRRAFFVTFAVFALAYCSSVYFGLELVTSRVLDATAERFVDPVLTSSGDEIVFRFGGAVPADPVDESVEEMLDRMLKVDQPSFDDLLAAQDTFDDVVTRMKTIGHAFFAVLLGLTSGVVAEAVVRKLKTTNGQSTA
jgi:hypothetical protein